MASKISPFSKDNVGTETDSTVTGTSETLTFKSTDTSRSEFQTSTSDYSASTTGREDLTFDLTSRTPSTGTKKKQWTATDTQVASESDTRPATIHSYVRIQPRRDSVRTVVLVRAAQRMDRIFPEWLNVNFTDHGLYIPSNLNQPLSIPKRNGGPSDFHNDTPITELGQMMSQMLGRSLHQRLVIPKVVFVSPALRCIQTAVNMLKHMDPQLRINVEPGLFEWRSWYGKMPSLLTMDEMKLLGYPINPHYTPAFSLADIGSLGSETVEELFSRQRATMDKILCQSPSTCTVLVVGHGVTLDACARGLLRSERNREEQSKTDMNHLGHHYPGCSLIGLEETEGKRKQWKLIESFISPLTLQGFSNKVNTEYLLR